MNISFSIPMGNKYNQVSKKGSPVATVMYYAFPKCPDHCAIMSGHTGGLLKSKIICHIVGDS